MRSNRDFIEVHGLRTKKLHLVNKRSIIFVIKGSEDPDDQKAVITVTSGDHAFKIECEESYKDISEELLWCPNCKEEEEK